MFKIKDKFFDIKYAYLDAFISDNQLIFGLQIAATGTDKYLDNEADDAPDLFFSFDEFVFNSEILLKINSNEIEKWQDIAGKKIEWKDYPEDEQEPHALFYYFSHERVTNANIEFKTADNKIFVNIKATCDIYASDIFSNNLPLEIETEVDFYGILCGKKTEEQCRAAIQPFLDLSTLKFVQNKFKISIMVPNDTNMETNLLVFGKY